MSQPVKHISIQMFYDLSGDCARNGFTIAFSLYGDASVTSWLDDEAIILLPDTALVKKIQCRTSAYIEISKFFVSDLIKFFVINKTVSDRNGQVIFPTILFNPY